MGQFEFDVGTVVMVEADSEEEAKEKIKEHVDEYSFPNGFIMTAEILERRG